MTEVAYAVEGWGDEPVAAKLIRMVGCIPRKVFTADGKSKLDQKIPGYNRSAEHLCWLVLRDLDHDDDGTCVPDVLEVLLKGPPAPRLSLRLAVRVVEAWLLADTQAFSEFFRVPPHRLPAHPDSLDDPKRALVDACRASTTRAIRDAMVPREGSGRAAGPEYSSTIRLFAADHWDIERATDGSPSLRRAVLCVERMVASGAW
jgi:hypothetical protein